MTPVHVMRPRLASVVAIAALTVFGIAGCATVPDAGVPSSPSTARPVPSSSTPHPSDTVDATGGAVAFEHLPIHPDVLVIGDSYTEGYGLTNPKVGWASIVAATLGWNATIDGIGGTGFTKGTATDGRTRLDFRTRLAQHGLDSVDYDLIVLQGGLNDWTAEPVAEEKNVRGAVAAARGLWPEAVVIVFGPAEPTSGIDYSGQLHIIRAGAVDAGAIFIDPGGPEPWVNGGNTPLFDLGDGLHMNDAGHAYLAARFVAAVESLAR